MRRYQLFQRAVSGGNVAILKPKTSAAKPGQCKTHTLRAANGDLRIVALNRAINKTCVVKVNMEGKEMLRQYGRDAKLEYMSAANGALPESLHY